MTPINEEKESGIGGATAKSQDALQKTQLSSEIEPQGSKTIFNITTSSGFRVHFSRIHAGEWVIYDAFLVTIHSTVISGQGLDPIEAILEAARNFDIAVKHDIMNPFLEALAIYGILSLEGEA